MRVQRTFDHFVVLETLGVGGMGTVYKARDTLLDRLVALKLLRKDLSSEKEHTFRLRQEARVAASVNHPNVIQVFSSGTDHGQFYIVMELVEHGSLDDLIEQRTCLPEEQVVESGIQVAKGLRAAHRKGLIHQDVKPANILFFDEHTAKISDFGLAGAAAEGSETPGEVWATPYYVAPERLNNEPGDFRSDIYSLGATLFQAVAGKPPIEGETTSAIELRDLKNRPLDLRTIAPDVSAAMARILQRMIAPDPAQRFSSYDELVAELEQAQDALKERGRVNRVRRGRQPRFLISAVVLIVLAASVIFFVMRRLQENAGASASLASPGPSVEQKAEEKSRARPEANPSPVSPVPAAAERKKIADLERASWNATLTKYKEQIALYDFAGASATIKNVQLSEVSLKQAQESAKRKVGWLLDWKNRLIADLNKEQFSGSFRDINGTSYIGIREGTPERLFLRTARRTVELPWTKLQPTVLLAISASFIRLNAPGAVDRQWRCAVFASEFGQMELAREFAEAAAKGKPQYREEMSQLFSVAH
jgi:serine/threonine protein kinase